jgi:hypothetical protein
VAVNKRRKEGKISLTHIKNHLTKILPCVAGMIEGETVKNFKLHLIVLAAVIAAELIGSRTFDLGPGHVVVVPMFYALFFGLFTTPGFCKLADKKDVLNASGLLGLTLMLLMARYGTLVGASLPRLLAISPALFLQEIGHLGAVFLGVPVAVFLGLKRESVGATYSVGREPSVALISDIYGLSSPEGRGVLGVYISGSVFGAVFLSFLASFSAIYLPFHVYSLAMASGIGSASMMTSAASTLMAMYPQLEWQIAALAAASNMLSGLDVVYISLWLSLPLTGWLYQKCYRLKYGNAPLPVESMGGKSEVAE